MRQTRFSEGGEALPRDRRCSWERVVIELRRGEASENEQPFKFVSGDFIVIRWRERYPK